METISLFASLYPTPLKIVLNNSFTDTALEPHHVIFASSITHHLQDSRGKEIIFTYILFLFFLSS